jgi:hypothetical protein
MQWSLIHRFRNTSESKKHKTVNLSDILFLHYFDLNNYFFIWLLIIGTVLPFAAISNGFRIPGDKFLAMVCPGTSLGMRCLKFTIATAARQE